MVTVETATQDLIHALGNFLGIVWESRRAKEAGDPRMMDDAAIGAYALDRAPVLRASLDSLRGAMNRERIEAEE